MQAQKSVINQIKRELNDLEVKQQALTVQLNNETRKLQDQCESIGHQFDRYCVWDGHSNYTYYLCHECQYRTKSQPKIYNNTHFFN